MSAPTHAPIELIVDLTVFGDSEVIETRVPRHAYGRLRVGETVLVLDDSVAPRPFRVDGLSNDERDVRLVAL